MAVLALVCVGVYLALAFGLRTAIQLARTGSSGFKGIGGRPFSAEWSAGVLFAVALALGVVAPVLAATGAVEPLNALDVPTVHTVGVALFLLGLGGTLVAQLAMGTSWRIGVDPSERTELVTDGPFRMVRNPIFAAMIPASLGLAAMVPNTPALAGIVALVVALELQVRVVEEPYLLDAHGERYEEYAARVGRFVPGVGTLSARATGG